MPYKICPHCKEVSYSACESGEWKCPKCGADLSHVEATVTIKKKTS